MAREGCSSLVPHKIASVTPGSIAAECGLAPGDLLLSINGEPVIDQIDYQFLTAGDKIVLEIQDLKGIVEIDIEKEAGEPLGITLSETLMSRPRACKNKCMFCFIDQMPRGMRSSLYVKDDDWRLSLMMGNYITLTNLSDDEFDRIIKRRASPLYLSIHATDATVRARMMGSPEAGNLLPQLSRLKEAGIRFHCQIVLCPGVNDGPVLDDTLETLSSLYPAARSAALVPVGLTAHREGLSPIRPFDSESAARLLSQAHAWQKRLLSGIGTRFAFPADELYCLAGAALPDDGAYEQYPQIENGVGLLRRFEVEFAAAFRFHDPAETKKRSVLVVTGISAAPFLRGLIESHPIEGVRAEVVAAQNDFFGPSITVAGLLTGRDILRAIEGKAADELLLPDSALRREDGLFLDDMPLSALAEKLPMRVRAVECDGAAFFDALQGVY